LLFLTQATLIATARIAIHRRLGIIGGMLAGVFVVLGCFTVVEQARCGFDHGKSAKSRDRRRTARPRRRSDRMTMKRREFVLLVGATWAWPTVVFGQQQSMPVIGYLSGGSPGPFAPLGAAFRQGLKQVRYVEGDNVAIEYRWAEGHYERLPTLSHRRP
jgi:hypothetical protein